MNSTFRFIYDKHSISEASVYQQASSHQNFLDLLFDLTILAETEFCVCTFTSNVCRFVYEMMHSKYNEADVSFRIKSMDNHFYIAAWNTFTKKAILDHSPSNTDEIELKKGDLISYTAAESNQYLAFTVYQWNGFFLGTNLRTRKKGKFPTYKVVDYYAHVGN